MNIKNLKRAAEINGLMTACMDVRASLSESDGPFTVNGIELPHELSYRILQVINLEINQLHEEVERL